MKIKQENIFFNHLITIFVEYRIRLGNAQASLALLSALAIFAVERGGESEKRKVESQKIGKGMGKGNGQIPSVKINKIIV